jgi:DNA-directed RNA polymerase subunit RPC12/RpoP
MTVTYLEDIRKKRTAPGDCLHRKVFVDPLFSVLSCRDCGAELNPFEWISALIEGGTDMLVQLKKYKALNEIICEHCGKRTPLPPLETDH